MAAMKVEKLSLCPDFYPDIVHVGKLICHKPLCSIVRQVGEPILHVYRAIRLYITPQEVTCNFHTEKWYCKYPLENSG